MTTGPVVIAGFATLDYVVQVDGDFSGRGTLLMLDDNADAAWPRAGGAALYAGAALAQARAPAIPLTWIGDDVDGLAYQRACRRAGLALEGVAVQTGAPTTRCLLIYNADGSYGCLLRPGPTALTVDQLALAGRASWLVISAGPPQIAGRLLDIVPTDARVAWIFKGDPACFPPDLAARLADRADVVFCNSGERALLEMSRASPRPAGQILFETRGADGVRVEDGVERFEQPAASVQASDTTGAGDTFAGAALAVLAGGDSARSAARAGVDAAAALLSARVR